MFTIIGGDGKEYGPVTLEQIKVWIAAGRANLDTKVKAAGSEEWCRLGDFAEFNPNLGAPPVFTPPPPGFGGAPFGGQAATLVPGATLADRGTRLGARLIDWGLEFVVAIPGAIILGGEFVRILIAASRGQEPDFSQLDIARLITGGIVLACAALVLLVIQVWQLTTRGQTLGKRIVGIKIVKHPDGSAPGIVHAWLVREVVITLIGIVVNFVPILGPLLLRPVFHIVDWCMIFRADQRCLHDLIAGTQVVKA